MGQESGFLGRKKAAGLLHLLFGVCLGFCLLWDLGTELQEAGMELK